MRVKVINMGREECEMEFTEVEELTLDKLAAELETASTKYSAAFAVWLQQPEILKLRAGVQQAKNKLQDQVKTVFKRIDIDESTHKYNFKAKQIERQAKVM